MQFTPPTFLPNYMRQGQVYANYFLPLHQNPKPIIPTPTHQQKNVDSRQQPMSKPNPKAISAQPHSWFFRHIKNTPCTKLCRGCCNIPKISQCIPTSQQYLFQHRHTGQPAIAAIFDGDDKGKGIFLIGQKASKHSIGL